MSWSSWTHLPGQTNLQPKLVVFGNRLYALRVDPSKHMYILDVTPYDVSVTASPSSVVGGASAAGGVSVSASAPSGGVHAVLSSSNPAVASVRGASDVVVPGGLASIAFTIDTVPVSSAADVVFSVTNAGGSKSATLHVVPPSAASVAVTPSEVVGGDTSIGTVTLNGPAPAGGYTVSLAASDAGLVTVPPTVTIGAGQKGQTFSVATCRTYTSSDVTISASAGGNTVYASLAVTALPPSLSSLAPSTVAAGGPALTLTLTGSGFLSGSVVRWNGADLATVYASDTQLTATIPAANRASAGAASVTVFNASPGGGTSNALTFTVTTRNPAPTVGGITPNAGLNTGSVSVTNLAGSKFFSGASVKLTLSGKPSITATNVVVVSAMKITCTFDLKGAAPGSYSVVVTNPDGQSGSKASAFTVKRPPAPTVSAITPNAGLNNGSVSITNLAGANFVTGAGVKLSASGKSNIVATNVKVVSATKITCTLNLTSKAAGTYAVVVTNPDGQVGTKASAFTVKAR